MYKQYKVELIPSQTETSDLGKRTKFGGKPQWIQNNETPVCKHCKKEMDFVAQIDSFDYTGRVTPQPDFMFGDVGMIYVFYCKDCGETIAIHQE